VSFHDFVAEVFPPTAGEEPSVPTPPYDTDVVALWVGDMADRGVCAAATAVAGLNKHHVNAGGAPLREAVAVQQALEGWARLKPPPVPKKPFTAAMLVRVAERADVQSLQGARDFAMLVVARGGAFRGESELLAAQLPLRMVRGGAEVDVHTKTDKNVHTTTSRRIPAAGAAGLAPLTALQHYLELSGHTSGFVFRNVSGGGARARSNLRPVSRSTLSTVVKTWAERLGENPAEYAAHSLKHGCAADLKNADVPTAVATRVTGHASVRTYDGYGGAAAQARALAVRRRLAREERAAAVVTDAQLEAEAWRAASYGPPETRFPRFD
jgi:integrase